MASAADAFIRAASVPFDAHASGTLDEAERLRAAHPSVTAANVYAAAVAGNDVAVRGFLTEDATSASRKGGPHGWDPLTYLCFSRYLRLQRQRSKAFVRTA
ncbi:MAG: ankyrin repeat domain-containing protein, partial [Vicinamibacteraceae bacterium]